VIQCARGVCVSAAVVAAAALSWVACTSDTEPVSQRHQLVSTAATSRVFTRSCPTAVYGSLGKFTRWSRTSIIVGPVSLVWVREAGSVPRSRFDRPQAVKVLALLKQGRSATITVPTSERRRVSLLFDPAGFTGGPYQVGDGESVAAFRACSGGGDPWGEATQFNGGIIVAGARCVSLDVHVTGSPTRRVRSPFGRGTCTSTKPG
jgi:hypothetical protein